MPRWQPIQSKHKRGRAALTEENVVEAAIGEVGIDEQEMTGGSTAAKQRHQVAVLHLEQEPDLVQELAHALP